MPDRTHFSKRGRIQQSFPATNAALLEPKVPKNTFGHGLIADQCHQAHAAVAPRVYALEEIRPGETASTLRAVGAGEGIGVGGGRGRCRRINRLRTNRRPAEPSSGSSAGRVGVGRVAARAKIPVVSGQRFSRWRLSSAFTASQ